jgi:predicted aldo/keto reductase-like oxidoreductase
MDLYCTGCGYCMPCPNDVNIPENFRYMNWHRVWGLEEEARKAYAKLGEPNNWGPWAGTMEGLRAEHCVECGECLTKCPQDIPIVAQLREVAQTLS